MLDIKCLGRDIELISIFLDEMISKTIDVISILDGLSIHTETFYSIRLEKSFFLNKVVKSQEEGKKKTYMPINQLNGTAKEKNKKIGAYCRVSSREQVQGYSIDNQKEKIQMYLELFDYETGKINFLCR